MGPEGPASRTLASHKVVLVGHKDSQKERARCSQGEGTQRTSPPAQRVVALTLCACTHLGAGGLTPAIRLWAHTILPNLNMDSAFALKSRVSSYAAFPQSFAFVSCLHGTRGPFYFSLYVQRAGQDGY